MTNNKKTNVGIIFGGKSTEHRVSLKSAKNIFDAIDKKKYNPILVKIRKSGKWILDNGSSNHIALIPQSNGKLFNFTKNKYDTTLDVVFPILHGAYGEDGTIQGLLKLANVPFVGAGVLGSAIGMDKDIMKRLLRDAKIPIGEFITFNINYEEIPEFETIKNKFGFPVFIKPANNGSSIGINKANNKIEYLNFIKNAAKYDSKIIIEKNINGREIECSVLGNNQPIASIPGEIVPADNFYSYKEKYSKDSETKLIIPAKIHTKDIEKIQKLAIKTFKYLSCKGLGRIDFFLKNNGEIIVNEINTIPGFANTSMYPKLWKTSRISYTELIDKLIQLAIEEFQQEKKLKTNYN